jgi:hypothetical protein
LFDFELQEAFPTRDEIDQDQNDRDHQQNVNKGTDGVASHKTEKPQDDQNDGNGV